MEILKKKWAKSALCLSLFTLFSVSLVVTVQATIYEKYILNSQRNRLQSQLAVMLPGISFNNNLIIQHKTGAGYGGDIVLLTSITPDGDILKVSVTRHNETPGLGDLILQTAGGWLDQFTGANLSNRKFAVKKEGGDFTYTTGATITPRAVVNAEKDLLEYFLNHKRRFELEGSCNGD